MLHQSKKATGHCRSVFPQAVALCTLLCDAKLKNQSLQLPADPAAQSTAATKRAEPSSNATSTNLRARRRVQHKAKGRNPQHRPGRPLELIVAGTGSSRLQDPPHWAATGMLLSVAHTSGPAVHEATGQELVNLRISYKFGWISREK